MTYTANIFIIDFFIIRGFIVDLYDLPDGWEWFLIDQIGEIVTGNTPSKSQEEYYGNDFPFFKPSDLNSGYYVEQAEDHLSSEGIKKARFLPAKSILVTCIGSIGKTGLTRVEGSCNQQINAIIPNKNLVPEYIYFWCISTLFKNTLITESSSTTLAILNKSRFSSLNIPIAPLNEQKRIVEKIELIQERTKIVKRELENIKVLLKKLRRSLLASAFRGDLTKDWRANHPDIEPAEVLLERIKQERRSKWEQAELEKMRAKGITPKDDKWKSKYSEPQPVKNIDDLPSIPDGWCWVNYELLTQESQNGLSKRTGSEGLPIFVLRLADIQNNKINSDEPRKILLTDSEQKRYLLKLNDLLCIRVNGSENLVGRMIIFDQQESWAFCDHFIRFKLVDYLVNVNFIANFFNTDLARKYIKEFSVCSAGQNTISQ